jgi:hypothetical protein
VLPTARDALRSSTLRRPTTAIWTTVSQRSISKRHPLQIRAPPCQHRTSYTQPLPHGCCHLRADLDKCTTGIQRRKRRATATILDQRALLANSGGVSTKPSFWTRAQASCLRCLASVVEVSEILGRIRKEVAPSAPPALPSTSAPSAGASTWLVGKPEKSSGESQCAAHGTEAQL